MKITKQTLKQIIKEEITKFLYEDENALDTKKMAAAREDAAKDAKDDGDRGDKWENEYDGKYLQAYERAYRDAQSAALGGEHMYETNLNRRAKNPQK
jgi:long-subunit fatty acid transport protein